MIITFSGNLKRFTGFRRHVEVPGDTLADVLAELIGHYPELRTVLFDGAGAIRRSNRLFFNDDCFVGDLSQPVGDADELTVLTAIAGG